MTNRTAVVASLLLCIAACERTEPHAWVGAVDTVAGIPVVRNPADPLFGPDRVRIDLVWRTTGPAEADTMPLWQEPRSITALREGLYVLDAPARHVHHLDAATGEWRAYFGREGGGPGELLRPVAVHAWRGLVAVQDPGHRGLVLYEEQGGYVGHSRFDGLIFTFAPLGDTTALVTTMGLETDQGILQGESIRPFEPARAVAGANTAVPGCSRFSAGPGQIVEISCSVPHLRLLDESGHLLREIVVDIDPTPRSRAELDAYIERLRGPVSGSGMSEADVEGFLADQRADNRYRRAMRRVGWDPTTDRILLWEQEGEDFGAGPATFHVFTTDGMYLARFALEASIWDFATVEGDLVTLSREPHTGVVSAVRYRLEIPPPPARPG